MRVLVTGAGGFVGQHVIAEFARCGHEIHGFGRRHVAGLSGFVEGDIQDPDALGRAVAAASPDACVHLAGVSFVPAAESGPRAAFSVNVLGTLNLLEAIVHHRPEARVLVVSTARVYGASASPAPVRETAPLAPDTMYALSKASADQAAMLYARTRSLKTIVVRPHNHTGPGQSPDFVVPAFARQLKSIQRDGRPAEIRVGNLDSARDFMDVRDVAQAYRLLVERGVPGEAYNLASGTRVSIRDILSELCRIAAVDPRIVNDASRMRPTDTCATLDTTKLRTHTGWEPRVLLTKTLRDVYAAA